jgi:hypothetical protein
MKAVWQASLLLLLSGCSVLNMFKGPDDYYRHYAAGIIKEVIDKDIQEEVRRDVPNGYKTQPYSREVWNEYWNGRIATLYDIGKTDVDQAYRGPSGPEFIRYILDSRRANGLPELQIEECNRDKVP